MTKSCQIIAIALCLFFPLKQAVAIDLLFPVACRVMTDCWITNHVDLDNNSGRSEDYMCGKKTRDGSLSTHISLGNIQDVTLNMAVIASADGTIDFAGNIGGFCGGRILIDHGGGWESSYCHLNLNTLQVSEGDTVTQGQILGSIGMSGQSSWPHLSFALLRNGMAFDPFSGRTNLEGCSKKSQPLWAGGMNPLYEPAQVTNIGFTVEALDNDAILRGNIADVTEIAAATPQLTLWAMLMNVMEGDLITMRVLEPSGRILNETETTAQTDRDYFPVIFMTRRNNFIWDNGDYRGSITITRRVNDNEITVGQFTTVRLTETRY